MQRSKSPGYPPPTRDRINGQMPQLPHLPMGQMRSSRLFRSEPRLPTKATYSLAYALLAFLLSLPHFPTPHLGVLPLPELYPRVGFRCSLSPDSPKRIYHFPSTQPGMQRARCRTAADQGPTRTTQYFLLSVSFLQPEKFLLLEWVCFALIILSSILPNLYLCPIPWWVPLVLTIKNAKARKCFLFL